MHIRCGTVVCLYPQHRLFGGIPVKLALILGAFCLSPPVPPPPSPRSPPPPSPTPLAHTPPVVCKSQREAGLAPDLCWAFGSGSVAVQSLLAERVRPPLTAPRWKAGGRGEVGVDGGGVNAAHTATVKAPQKGQGGIICRGAINWGVTVKRRRYDCSQQGGVRWIGGGFDTPRNQTHWQSIDRPGSLSWFRRVKTTRLSLDSLLELRRVTFRPFLACVVMCSVWSVIDPVLCQLPCLCSVTASVLCQLPCLWQMTVSVLCERLCVTCQRNATVAVSSAGWLSDGNLCDVLLKGSR